MTALIRRLQEEAVLFIASSASVELFHNQEQNYFTDVNYTKIKI